jgi:ribonuclease P protein component
LNRKSSIAFLFDKGAGLLALPIKITWCKTEVQSFPLCVMFNVSKKNFPSAVHRNRIKRLMRETYRHHKKEIILLLAEKNMNAMAAFLYTGKTLPTHAEMENTMQRALKKLTHEIVAANT